MDLGFGLGLFHKSHFVPLTVAAEHVSTSTAAALTGSGSLRVCYVTALQEQPSPWHRSASCARATR